jgi:carbonic anhydrase
LAKVGEADGDLLRRTCEHEVIKISLANLAGFSWVRERVAAGTLALHGWYFDIERGELLVLDQSRGEFERVV